VEGGGKIVMGKGHGPQKTGKGCKPKDTKGPKGNWGSLGEGEKNCHPLRDMETVHRKERGSSRTF